MPLKKAGTKDKILQETMHNRKQPKEDQTHDLEMSSDQTIKLHHVK